MPDNCNIVKMYTPNLSYPAQCERRSLYIAGPLDIEKYKANFYDVSGMRRYSGNILQWSKIKTKNMNYPLETTGFKIAIKTVGLVLIFYCHYGYCDSCD